MNVGDTLTLLDIYRIWVEIPGDRPWSAAAAASHGNAVRVLIDHRVVILRGHSTRSLTRSTRISLCTLSNLG